MKCGWPKGRLRHPDESELITEINEFIEQNWKHGVVTPNALARAIGVSQSNVHSWLTGVNMPPPDQARRMREWLNERRSALGD